MDDKTFIALAGNIGCGKTTAAKLLSRHFGLELFDEPVIDNRFLANYYGDMRRWSFTLQLEFLIKRVEHHELIEKVPKSCIQDRTLIEDPEIFAKYLHGLGHMTDDELDLYFEYFQRLNKSIRHMDVLTQRISKRGREEEKDIPVDFLMGLNGYYSAFPNIVESKYGIRMMRFDVSKFNIHEPEQAKAFVGSVEDFLAS